MKWPASLSGLKPKRCDSNHHQKEPVTPSAILATSNAPPSGPCLISANRMQERIRVCKDALDLNVGSRQWFAIDTEFTRLPYRIESMAQWLASARLLSMACVPLTQSEHGEFYGKVEITDALRRLCAPFVRTHVLPALNCSAIAIASSEQLGKVFELHLTSMASCPDKPIGLIATSRLDFILLSPWLNAVPGIEVVVLNDHLVDHTKYYRHGEVPHHALNDARALARAVHRHTSEGGRTNSG